MCSVVILATRADAQSAALLAPSVGPSSTLECQQLALGSLSCFHKATSMVPLKSCPGTVVVVHLDPLWERQFRLWPSPAPMHTPCGSPTVLLDVLQMLSLQSWCWKWKFATRATTGRGFSPASVSGQRIGICSLSWLRWQLGCEGPRRQECPPVVAEASSRVVHTVAGPVLGERGDNGSPAPPFTHRLTMVLCLCGGSGFLL